MQLEGLRSLSVIRSGLEIDSESRQSVSQNSGYQCTTVLRAPAAHGVSSRHTIPRVEQHIHTMSTISPDFAVLSSQYFGMWGSRLPGWVGWGWVLYRFAFVCCEHGE